MMSKRILGLAVLCISYSWLPTSVYADVLPVTNGHTSHRVTDSWIHNPTMGPGDSGGYVIAIQEMLLGLGYLSNSAQVNGRYDINTKSAVKSFQSASGLAATGVVGSQTWQAFYQLISQKQWDVPPTYTGYSFHGEERFAVDRQSGVWSVADDNTGHWYLLQNGFTVDPRLYW